MGNWQGAVGTLSKQVQIAYFLQPCSKLIDVMIQLRRSKTPGKDKT